jgi:tetratricopeptide (TPR) repeat protein
MQGKIQGAIVLAAALILAKAGSAPSPLASAALEALRDVVYDDLPCARAQELADAARNIAAYGGAANGGAENGASGLDSSDIELYLSRIDYYLGRSYNEAGDKKKALPLFESALAHARASGEDRAASLLAAAQALSQLCSLKDVVFLVSNGPKVLQYAKKILDTEQNNAGAALIQAQAKAYAPGIFGGAPAKALVQLDAMEASHPEGLEKETLFDLQVCRGTALEKLGRKEEAKSSFRSALGLYPGNLYAQDCLARVSK